MLIIRLETEEKFSEIQEGFSMKNIYTIKLELCNNDYIPYSLFEEIGNFMIMNNDVCLFSDFDKSKIRNMLYDNLNEESQFIVKNIDKSEINKLPSRFSEWLKPLVFDDELKDFETHNQEMINKTMKYLNYLDKKLGGVYSGKKSNKCPKKPEKAPTKSKN